MSKRQAREAGSGDSGLSQVSPAKSRNRALLNDPLPSRGPKTPGVKPLAEKQEYEEKKAIVAQLKRMGWSFRLIGQHPKVQLSKTTVHEMWEKMLDERSRNRRRISVESWRWEKLEELQLVKKYAYEVFLKSSEPHHEEITTTDDAPQATAKGKAAAAKKIRTKVQKKLSGRDGSIHALALIKEVIDSECELLGLKSGQGEQSVNILAAGGQIKFFLPTNNRNKKQADGEYVIPHKAKKVEAVAKPSPAAGTKPLPTRPTPSELSVIERKPLMEGAEEIR